MYYISFRLQYGYINITIIRYFISSNAVTWCLAQYVTASATCYVSFGLGRSLSVGCSRIPTPAVYEAQQLCSVQQRRVPWSTFHSPWAVDQKVVGDFNIFEMKLWRFTMPLEDDAKRRLDLIALCKRIAPSNPF